MPTPKLDVPTEAQADVLREMLRTNLPLERRMGGFWTTPGRPNRGNSNVPEWNCSTLTVQAMERRGWLTLAGRFPESWKDDRVLTDKGREVAGCLH